MEEVEGDEDEDEDNEDVNDKTHGLSVEVS